jgi:hypothetical protein
VPVALTYLASHILSLPIALGGEAETSNNLGLGILSVVSIAVGWVGLFALWYFVFRDKSRAKRNKDSSSG